MSKRLFGLFVFAGISIFGALFYSLAAAPKEVLASHEAGHYSESSYYSQSAYPEIENYSVTADNYDANTPATYYVDFKIENRAINSGESIKVTFPADAANPDNGYDITEYAIHSDTTPNTLETGHSFISPGTIELKPGSTISDGSNIHIVIDGILSAPAGTHNVNLDVTGFNEGDRNYDVTLTNYEEPPTCPGGQTGTPPDCATPPPGSGWGSQEDIDNCSWRNPKACFNAIGYFLTVLVPNAIVSVFVNWIVVTFLQPLVDLIVGLLVNLGVWVLEASMRVNSHF